MDNGFLYDIAHDFLAKESKSGILKPDTFQRYLQTAAWELYGDEYFKFQDTQRITDTLKVFIDRNNPITLTTGVGALPADYKHLIGVPYYGIRPVDVVSYQELRFRKGNSLTLPTERNPVLVFDSSGVYVEPTTIAAINIDYLKNLTPPVFDYYVNTNVGDLVVYMPVGSQHTLLAGEVYRDGTSSGVVNSISVELQFTDEDKLKVLHKVLEMMGVESSDQEVYEYGTSKQQKDAVL